MPKEQPISPVRGIILMSLAIMVFTAMAAFVKAADRVPAGQAVFFRTFFSFPVIFAWLAMRHELTVGLRTKNWRGHFVRSIAGAIAMGLGFAGLKYLPLPEVTGLRFVTPIAIVILAALLLGERIRLIRITAVFMGLVGVAIILAPRITATGESDELFGAGLILASAIMAALAQVFVKAMSNSEHPAAISFYFMATAAFLSLFTIPFGWVVPTVWEAVLLVSAGLVGGLGQLLVTSSYKYADAGVLAPFTYTSMLWAILVGFVFFAEIPTLPMLVGSALIILSGAAIAWRERQLGRQMATKGKVDAKGMQ